jgi:UDP-N-acetylglucosamine 2-epimerase (non-hydrolysing)
MSPAPILVVIGTRPEAIKLAPVVYALNDAGHDVRVCTTGQHVELLDGALSSLSLAVHHRLSLSAEARTSSITYAQILEGVDRVLSIERPAWTVVQGDTTSAVAAATASFHQRIPVAHVEAGLRSGDAMQPWPEEVYRCVISRLASVHFAPTSHAKANLINEGIQPEVIEVTGNTIVDALRIASEQLDRSPALSLPAESILDLGNQNKLLIVATVHRREAFGPPLESIGSAFIRLAERGDCEIVVVAHPNPATLPLRAKLKGHPRLHLVPPLDYFPFVALLRRADLIMTDSGGIQEEAAALGRPVLVLRNCTERHEVVSYGNGRLVGWDEDNIVDGALELLCDSSKRRAMSRLNTSFGDGRASERIAARLQCSPPIAAEKRYMG